jgi:alpha-beta hydrolase superfamily lysophospholipase
LESNAEIRPGIILMHELGVWVNPWIDSPLLKRLVSEGYVCLTYFFRGHGSSSSIDGGMMSLFDDKSLIARDLDAAISFMNDNELVTRDNLGLIGASLGGIMALAGNGYEEVKTSVSLSAPADGVYEIFPDMTLSSVFYLVGELDIRPEVNADLPRDAQMLYNSTEAPKKLIIVEGTSDHGTALLSGEDLNISIQEWILEMLPLN